jgi:hypothetical protein
VIFHIAFPKTAVRQLRRLWAAPPPLGPAPGCLVLWCVGWLFAVWWIVDGPVGGGFGFTPTCGGEEAVERKEARRVKPWLSELDVPEWQELAGDRLGLGWRKMSKSTKIRT